MHVHVPIGYEAVASPFEAATDISFREVDGSVVFDLQGPLATRWVAAELCHEVRKLLEAGRRNFTFNLAEVPYADSAGVGALIACRSAIQSAGGKLILLAARRRIVEMLKRMRVDPIFVFRDDEPAALSRS